MTFRESKKSCMLIVCLYLLVCLFGSVTQGCHDPRLFYYKRSISSRSKDKNVKNSHEMRKYFTACLEKRFVAWSRQSDKAWQSIVDFSILDTTWYDKFQRQVCPTSDGQDTVNCWRKAIIAYLDKKSVLFNASLSCIDDFAKSKNDISVPSNDPDCTTGGWTSFFNRDKPGRAGDNELLVFLRKEFPGRICNKPTAIDARVATTGQNYATTRQNVAVNKRSGLACVNTRQTDRRCHDYMVRYCCPKDITSRCKGSDWTRYYSDNKPNIVGEYENIASLRKNHPEICEFPSEIQATLLDGTHSKYAKEDVSLNLSMGLSCNNSEQKGGKRCSDYQVRFCCPSVKTNRHIWYVYPQKKPISKTLKKSNKDEATLRTYGECLGKSDADTSITSNARSSLHFQSILWFVDEHVIYCDNMTTDCSQRKPVNLRIQEMIKKESPILQKVKECNRNLFTARSRSEFQPDGWGQWTSWGHCPARCGERGRKLRRRSCLIGAPGQAPCYGSLHDTKLCQPDYCPKGWSAWSPCQATCGFSRKMRTKYCKANHSGDPVCRNPSREVKRCYAGKCPSLDHRVSLGWTLWQQWSACHALCGRTDFRRRRRTCTRFSPGSRYCPGPSYGIQVCKGKCRR